MWQVRQLFDEIGRIANYASPSTPVQILGWRSLPVLGDRFIAVESEVNFFSNDELILCKVFQTCARAARGIKPYWLKIGALNLPFSC